MNYSIARTPHERMQAVALIKDVYTEEGYTDAKSSSDISAFLQDERVRVFTAEMNGQLFGTISVVPDSERGLPMDVIFNDELEKKRTLSCSIAEVCQFAIDKKMLQEKAKEHSAPRDLEVSMGLLRLVFNYASCSNIDLLAFTINPKHRVFYESLGAVRVGEERAYPSVNNAPALAYFIDIKELASRGETKSERSSWILDELMRDPLSCDMFIA